MAYAVRSSRVGTPGFLRELQQAVWAVNPRPAARRHADARGDPGALDGADLLCHDDARRLPPASRCCLGVVGIYGVIAYIATQRTREIGIRMALGAQIGDVRRMFLRHGLWLTATGIALGFAAALTLTRVMSALLFGVQLDGSGDLRRGVGGAGRRGAAGDVPPRPPRGARRSAGCDAG